MSIPISQFTPPPIFLLDIHTFVLYLWGKKKSDSHWVMTNSLQLHGLYSPCNSAGQNTGVDSLSLLKGIFPTQESNPGLPHCRQILYQLSQKGSPRILEWVGGLSLLQQIFPTQELNRVSCSAGWFFTNWDIREAPCLVLCLYFCFVNKIIYINFLNPQRPQYPTISYTYSSSIRCSIYLLGIDSN